MTARAVRRFLAAALLAGAAARAQTPPAGTTLPQPQAPQASPGQPAAAQPAAPATPTPAVLEKLAQGDRAFVAGEFRAALFAYQDAVYAQPGYLFSRVKLGRAYLAMHYPSFASAQAELVLASDPTNPDAQQLLDEARRTPGREIAGTAGAAGAGVAAAGARPPPRAYKIPDEQASPAAGAAPAAAGGPAPGSAPAAGTAAAGGAAVAAAPAPPAPAPAPAPTAAQRYRAGVELYGKRDYAGAVTELSEAIALDPRLAVAYAARASARFGLGRYREAADDYKASLGLDPGLSTPLYGLAECYRLLGDPAAAEMYQRYVDSKSPDVREDLRALAAKRAAELSGK